MDPMSYRAKHLLTAAAALFLTAALPAAQAAAAPAALPVGPVGGTISEPQIAAPDLQVTIQTLSCSQNGRDVVARVKNIGSRTSGSFSVLLDAGWQHEQHPVASLAVGQQLSFPMHVNFAYDLVARIGPGTSVSMTVDSNTANDSATNTALSSGCPLPDLRVRLANDRVYVDNIGTGASRATTLRTNTTQLHYSFGGWHTDYDSSTTNVPSIAAGASFEAGPYGGCSFVFKRIWFWVDPDGTQVELNESNNDDGCVYGWG